MNSYLNVFLTDNSYEEIKEHYIKVIELSKNGSVENEEILVSVFQEDADADGTGKDRVVQIAHNLKFSKVFLSNPRQPFLHLSNI